MVRKINRYRLDEGESRSCVRSIQYKAMHENGVLAAKQQHEKRGRLESRTLLVSAESRWARFHR